MTEAVQIELIRAIPSFFAAFGGVSAAWFSFRAVTHSREAIDIGKSVARNTDGISERLNKLTAKSSHAEGVLDEKERAAHDGPYVEPTTDQGPPAAR